MDMKNEHFVTCGQMKVLERRADESGLSYYQMMENAGGAAARIIMDSDRDRIMSESIADTHTSHQGNVLVFCGKGNNGGDGLVVSRLMCDAGYKVGIILVDGPPVTENSRKNLGLLEERPVRITDMTQNAAALIELEDMPDIIIDAIYGTGFHGDLKGNGLKAAVYMNSFSDPERNDRKNTKVFALDIPSGMGGDMIDEEKLDRRCVKAHCTVAFHAMKPVHLQSFASGYCGKIAVADIGIDEEDLWNV